MAVHSPNPFPLVNGWIFFVLERVAVDVSAVPFPSIAEHIRTQLNVYS